MSPDAFSAPAYRRLIECAMQHLEQDGRVSVRGLLDALINDENCGSLVSELSMLEQHYDGLLYTSQKREEIIYETADLLFHTLLVLGYHDVTLNEVYRELGTRFGKSGIRPSPEGGSRG